MKKEVYLKVILILSLIGIATSFYLLYEHYATGSSVCDVNATVSCSLVNSSVFSELVGVPVALLGIFWFLAVIWIAQKAKKDKQTLNILFWWHLLGLLSVIYLVTAEFILQAICPFCTVVHIIIIAGLIISFFLQRDVKINKKKITKILKPFVVVFVIINLLPLIFFNLPSNEEDHSKLALCLTEKGVNMYGSFKCGVCAKTRAMFGKSFDYLTEIECHPQGENAQTDLCLSKNIKGTPTWIIEPNGEEVKRQEGFMSTEELAEWAGCTNLGGEK